MNLHFGFLLALLVIGHVVCERCDVNATGAAFAQMCSKEQCDSSSHMVCFHTDPGDLSGWCTCAWGHDPAKPKPTDSSMSKVIMPYVFAPTVPCTRVESCTADKYPYCRTAFMYCLNSFCRCLPGVSLGSFPGVGKK